MQTLDKTAILTLAQTFAHRKGKLYAAEWAMNWLGISTFGIIQIVECGRKMRYVNTGGNLRSNHHRRTWRVHHRQLGRLAGNRRT